ncbi:MFS transporter [Holophaga foetida]|uniref:MFS transporter n=1 Tax=Holophaga foetida TaxID=35839 RepID=UPI0002474CBF|nr:MFS transporter [Holophaga foetida]
MRKLFDNPWWIAFGSLLGLIVGNGPVMQFTFGVFVKPLTAAFHADRGTISIALAVGVCMTGIGTLIFGRLVDRYGIRKATLPAIMVFGLTLIAIGLFSHSPISLFIFYGIAGLAASGQTPLPYSKAIAANFDANRGLALGIAMAGVGLGTALLPAITQRLVAAFSWRAAYIGLGVLVLLIAVPSMALLVTKRKAAGTASTCDHKPLPEVLTNAEIFSSPIFWKFAITFFLVTFAANGVIGHAVPMITDLGSSPAKAAGAMGFAGMALIGGRLVAGWLLDRIHAPFVAIAFFLLPLIGILMMITTRNPSLAVPAMVLVAIGLGAEVDLLAFLQSRYMGLRGFGQIYGYLLAIFMAGTAFGVYSMGICYRHFGNYRLAMIVFAVGLVVSIVMMALLGEYVYRPNLQEARAK